MMKQAEKHILLCKELRRLGYGPHCRVRLYGEEFDLISNPVRDGSGYSIDGISHASGSVRHIRIPLPIVHTIEHELKVMDRAAVAA